MYDVAKRELDSVKKQLQELEEEHKLTVDKVHMYAEHQHNSMYIGVCTYVRTVGIQKHFHNVIVVQLKLQFSYAVITVKLW